MTRSLTAAITAMLMVTSSAWASPEGQAIRPMGDNQPDKSPTEQADDQRNEHARERSDNQQGERMKSEHRGSERQDREDWKDTREDKRSSEKGAGKATSSE